MLTVVRGELVGDGDVRDSCGALSSATTASAKCIYGAGDGVKHDVEHFGVAARAITIWELWFEGIF